MKIQSGSLAAGVGVSVKNQVFKGTPVAIPRKILVLGSAATEKKITSVAEPRLLFSAEEADSLYGSKSFLAMSVRAVFEGARGVVPIYALSLPEPSGAAAASIAIELELDGEIEAGVISLTVGDFEISVPVDKGETVDSATTKIATAINSTPKIPVTAAQKNGITLTCATPGEIGNVLSVTLSTPKGLKIKTPAPLATGGKVSFTGGQGVPKVEEALKVLGEGDEANTDHFTDIVNPFGLAAGVAPVLSALSTYNGVGNDTTGCYADTVHRPFRAITASSLDNLTTLIDQTDKRKDDRTNGVICVPGSSSHPAKIAGETVGVMARIATERPEESYIDQPLRSVDPGQPGGRWTKRYEARDQAVKSGLSPTRIKSGRVVLQNVVSFYRPDSVPVTSNGYRSMRNISILQNILHNVYAIFEAEKWKGVTVVGDVQAVSDIVARSKARDKDAVIDDLVALAEAFESKAWIYSAKYTIDQLKKGDGVRVRLGGDGFASELKVVLSGEGGILSTEILFDASVAIYL